MTAKLLIGSALLMALVGCGGAKSEVTVTGTDPQSLASSPAGVATMAFVDLEGGFRVDQLPTAVPNPTGEALMLEAPAAPTAGCTNAATVVNGNVTTTTVTFTNCAAANGNTTNGTMTFEATASGAIRSVMTTYNLTNVDTSGKKRWTYTGTKLCTIDTTLRQATISVPNGGAGVTVAYTDADNSANNKTYVYAPNLTTNWATLGQFKLWGTYAFTQGNSTITATILQANPLVWSYGVATCCYPTSGTLSLATGGMTADAVFGPTCGAVKLSGSSLALPACR